MLEAILFSTANAVVEYPIRMRMGASRFCEILDFAKFQILSNSRFWLFPDFVNFQFFFSFAHLYSSI